MRNIRRKYIRLLTFIIAFSMILSMHVTFAQPEGSATNQVSSWIDYFDEDGEIKNKEISHIIAIFVPVEELGPVGSITISKTLIDEDEQEITDDDTEFEFMIEMYDDELEVWNEIQGIPVFIAGGESETLEDLPLGLYRVTEDEDLPDGYSRVSSLFVEVTLSDDVDSEDADDDDPVIESVTVTPDPVPQAPPVIEVVETEPEPEPEMEVIEEPVPQATLPRTGASDPSVMQDLEQPSWH